MHGQQVVRLLEHFPQPVAFRLLPGEFVLADNVLHKVTVVMEHDAKDGNAFHRRTLCPCQ